MELSTCTDQGCYECIFCTCCVYMLNDSVFHANFQPDRYFFYAHQLQPSVYDACSFTCRFYLVVCLPNNSGYAVWMTTFFQPCFKNIISLTYYTKFHLYSLLILQSVNTVYLNCRVYLKNINRSTAFCRLITQSFIPLPARATMGEGASLAWRFTIMAAASALTQ